MKTLTLNIKMRPWQPLIAMLVVTQLFIASCSSIDAPGQNKIYGPGKTESSSVQPVVESTGTDNSYTYTNDIAITQSPIGNIGNDMPDGLLPKSTGTFYTETQPIKVFTIDNTKDAVITGAKGIKVFFPAMCFKLDNPATPVSVELQEYVTLSDMLFANLTTTSNGDLIETGGTVNIKAKADGKELALKDDKQIQLAFPTGNKKEGMQAFYGVETASIDPTQNGLVNWQSSGLLEQSDNSTWTNTSTGLTPYNYKIRFCDTVVQNNFKLYPWEDCFYNKPRSALFADTSEYKNILEYLNDNFNVHDSICSILEGKKIKMTFKVDTMGKIISLAFAGTTPKALLGIHTKRTAHTYSKVKRDLKRIFKNIPYRLVKAKPGLVSNTYVLNLAIGKTGADKTGIIDGLEAFNSGFYSNYTFTNGPLAVAGIQASETDYYFITSTKLNFINCDRFTMSSPATLTNFTIDAGAIENHSVKIIFKDINSLLNVGHSSTSFVATNVPKNKEVILVVTEVVDGKSYYAIKTANTSSVAKGFNFKPFTPDAMKNDLALMMK